MRTRGVFPALDGLRIVAVTAVAATHAAFRTGRYNRGWGRDILAHFDIGVAIFFVISGFLISREWLMPDRRTGGLPRLRAYLWRRCLRILPMYWVAVVIGFLTLAANRQRPWTDWLRHLLLLQAYGTNHLVHGLTQTWSLCTEAAFYLALPAIAWITVRLAGTRERVPVAAAAVALVLAVASLGWVGWYRANFTDWLVSAGYWLPTTLSWFVAGTWLAAVRLGADDPAARLHGHWSRVDRLGDSPGVCVSVGVCAFAIAITPVGGQVLDPFPTAGQAVAHTVLYLITAVALVLPAVLGHGHEYDATLGHPSMRYLGRISYSVFLLHLAILQGVANLLGQPVFTGSFASQFLLTMAVTLPLSAVAYHYVERPASRLRHRGQPELLMWPR